MPEDPMVQTTTASANHTRDHRSVLAAAEKQTLIWIAHRLPRWVTSDQLSVLGLAAMAAAGLSFAALAVTPWAAAGVVASLAANWFGDSLDGTLARVRNQQRPRFGYYVDHVIDVAGTAMLVAGLTWSARMDTTLALAVLAMYLMVAAESYLATHAIGLFRMSFFGVGPTELRILLAAGALSVMADPFIDAGPLAGRRLFDVSGVIAMAGLAFIFLFNACRNTLALYRAEPLASSNGERRAA
jgi:archaetidylinositol phosphate synthase